MSIDYWRKFFESGNGDIFEVITQAIKVAVEDCPNEFRSRRDEIAQKLFTCQIPRCLGCDGVEAKRDDGEVVKDVNDNHQINKGTCSTNVLTPVSDLNGNQVSCISFNEAEALNDIIEEERLIVQDMYRIKHNLLNSEDLSSSEILDSLRRLRLMDVSVQTLETTSIGTAVTPLRKHPRKEIAKLARDLVKSWKSLITEYITVTEAAKVSNDNDSPDSVKPPATDEEECGLPSPPLEEGIFFATDAFAPGGSSIEFSKFFDGLDDDGNLDSRSDDDGSAQNVVTETKNTRRDDNSVQNRKPQFSREQAGHPKDTKSQPMAKHETVIKQTKPSDSDLRSRKPLKGGFEQKANNEVRLQQKLDPPSMQKKPVHGEPAKPKPTENQLDQKLENAKRKLHQGYQQAENAKKQRTIQVMDLQDIPKQSLGNNNNKHSQTRPGSHNRNWANGRR